MADAVEAAARTRAEENFMVGSRFRIFFFVGAVQLPTRSCTRPTTCKSI
jgi:hypothetical protein